MLAPQGLGLKAWATTTQLKLWVDVESRTAGWQWLRPPLLSAPGRQRQVDLWTGGQSTERATGERGLLLQRKPVSKNKTKQKNWVLNPVLFLSYLGTFYPILRKVSSLQFPFLFATFPSTKFSLFNPNHISKQFKLLSPEKDQGPSLLCKKLCPTLQIYMSTNLTMRIKGVSFN